MVVGWLNIFQFFFLINPSVDMGIESTRLHFINQSPLQSG
jgi:hypothetical protein